MLNNDTGVKNMKTNEVVLLRLISLLEEKDRRKYEDRKNKRKYEDKKASYIHDEHMGEIKHIKTIAEFKHKERKHLFNVISITVIMALMLITFSTIPDSDKASLFVQIIGLFSKVVGGLFNC